MLTAPEIKSIAAAGEGYNAEFKVRVPAKIRELAAEVTNPGGLVSAIPLQEFGIRSHSRNPLVFGLFERMHLVEQIGSGIGRIRGEMARRNLPAPEFKTEGLFTVAFQRVSKNSTESSEKLVDKQIEILEMIELNRSVSKSEMAEKLNISTTSVDCHIRKLREKGILFRKGGGKGGWWEINDFTQ